LRVASPSRLRSSLIPSLFSVVERGRLRKNGFSYFDSHGLGLSSSGLNEQRGSLAFDLGAAWVEDASAKLGNWFCSDFEKVLNEADELNPSNGMQYALPGEACHEICQNPRAASSIGATQHTQISRGGSELWPVLRLEASPTHVAALDATLDLVQVGDQNDAAVLTIVTRKASSPAVVELLVSLRMRLLQLFGGRRIDFNLIASARGNGEFVLVFAPVAAMAFDPTMKAYFNPATGEVYDESQLPCATVDSSQGKGNILTYTPQAHALAMLGEHVVRRLFDFNRQPGARAAMVDFIADRYGVILRGSNGRTEHVGIPLELKLEPPPPLFERSKMASG